MPMEEIMKGNMEGKIIVVDNTTLWVTKQWVKSYYCTYFIMTIGIYLLMFWARLNCPACIEVKSVASAFKKRVLLQSPLARR